MSRLDDPDDHFPHKTKVAVAYAKQDGPAGANGPNDASTTGTSFMSVGIAEATGEFVAAQGSYEASPTRENYQTMNAAQTRLEEARLRHRRPRGGSINVVGIKAGE